MKNIKMLFLGIACVGFFFAGTSTVYAQMLDDAWFKLSVSAKGYEVRSDESVNKFRFKATAYMYLNWDSSDNEYAYYVYSENSPGVWELSFSDTFSLNASTEDYIFIPSRKWDVYSPDEYSYINFNCTSLIAVKLDKSGGLSSAKFSTLGAEVFNGNSPQSDEVYGGAMVKGKTVDENKVPTDLLF